MGVARVHLPALISDSVLSAVKAVDFPYEIYPVSKDLVAQPDPNPGDAVLFVHYFGWLNPATAQLRKYAEQAYCLIEDGSQALLSDWGTVPPTATIALSPRKFAPVSFGGWCNVQSDTDPVRGDVEVLLREAHQARLDRGRYLATRDADVEEQIENSYLDRLRSVETFLDSHPTEAAIPKAALQMLDATDWVSISQKRRNNWKYLHEALGGRLEIMTPPISDGVVPLNYVVRVQNRDSLRARLAERRVFCPAYWPLPHEIKNASFPEAVATAGSCLAFPIDQNCNESDMNFIADTVRALD